MEILAWNQPYRNIATHIGNGINTFVGPEPENKNQLNPAQFAAESAKWIDAITAAGAKCILRNPTGPLPACCTGIILSFDEPNGKGIAPAVVMAETNRLRAAYPGVRIFLTLAGDKITSIHTTDANYAAMVALYKAYAACADILLVDWYSKNRNAMRYPVTYTADAVRWLIAVTGAVVYAWWDANDQQLQKPTGSTDGVHPDINREPFPDEITQTVETSISAGAKGGGWFLTCDAGKYGWGVNDPLFPVRGDSFYPTVNRAGESMLPQYKRMAELNAKYGTMPGGVESRVAGLEAQAKLLRADLETMRQDAADANQAAIGAAVLAKAAVASLDTIRTAIAELAKTVGG